MTVKDETQRKQLEHQAIAKGWEPHELKSRVRAVTVETIATSSDGKSGTDKKIPRLKLVRGRLSIYKVLATPAHVLAGANGRSPLLIDYGFGVRRPFPEGEKKGFKDGDLLKRSGGHYVKTDVDDKLRYTYKAYVERVVDGDTLLVLIEGGGGNLVQERLRLRGIDCPELKTEAGARAKRFVEGKFRGLPFIIIRTYKEQVDNHARYLADVFYLPEETDAAAVAENGAFLNQELLDERLAIVYS